MKLTIIQSHSTIPPSIHPTTTVAAATMDTEGGAKPEATSNHGQVPAASAKIELVILLLRVLAFLSTLAATLVMALNKETKTINLGTIGTVPLKATLTAKFQHTPAFVFFVVVNAMVTFHNLLMLVVGFVPLKFSYRSISSIAIPILDLLNVALVSGGASAAVFMGELGRDGNSHARWNKICDKVDSYCDRGGGAMIASLVGMLLMIIICSISIIRLPNANANLSLHSSSN